MKKLLSILISFPVIALCVGCKDETNSHIVGFNSNGGSYIAPIKVNDGEKVNKPDDPKKDGFIFKGWYLDSQLSGEVYNFDNPIKSDVTLNAKWDGGDLNTYSVEFDTNGGSYIKYQTITEGEKATKPVDPIKDGSVFMGWYLDSSLAGNEFDFNTPITTNITLHAKWASSEN